MIILDVVADDAGVLSPEYEGILAIDRHGDAELLVYPWARRDMLIEWALGRVERFRVGGPEVDGGWREAADGSFQSCARIVSMADPFHAEPAGAQAFP